MAETQELLNQARALGEAIASHPAVQAFLGARAKTNSDTEAQQLLKGYAEQATRIRELEAQQKPVEVADKQKLAECEQKMASNEALKELMRTQADYIGLMNQVNQAMEAPLAQSQKSDPDS
jgi:cell fate (sporulation/competence/biofilm development) regulator YlbF (YheA/YmcA/DUF963 family)